MAALGKNEVEVVTYSEVVRQTYFREDMKGKVSIAEIREQYKNGGLTDEEYRLNQEGERDYGDFEFLVDFMDSADGDAEYETYKDKCRGCLAAMIDALDDEGNLSENTIKWKFPRVMGITEKWKKENIASYFRKSRKQWVS